MGVKRCSIRRFRLRVQTRVSYRSANCLKFLRERSHGHPPKAEVERVGRSRHRRCDPGRAHRLLHPRLCQHFYFVTTQQQITLSASWAGELRVTVVTSAFAKTPGGLARRSITTSAAASPFAVSKVNTTNDGFMRSFLLSSEPGGWLTFVLSRKRLPHLPRVSEGGHHGGTSFAPCAPRCLNSYVNGNQGLVGRGR